MIPIGTTIVTRYSSYWGGPGQVLSPDRWRWEATVDGYNGSGGYWITEAMRWDSDGELHHKGARTLSPAESRELEAIYAGVPPVTGAIAAGAPQSPDLPQAHTGVAAAGEPEV